MPWPVELISPAGFPDGTILGPEHLQQFDQRILSLAEVLRHQGLEQWQSYVVASDGDTGTLFALGAYRESPNSTAGRVLAGWRVSGTGDPQRRALVAFGSDVSSNNWAAYSLGHGSWNFEAHGIGGTPYYANGDSGVLIANVLGQRSIARKVDYTTAWSVVQNVTPAGQCVSAMHYSASGNRLLIGVGPITIQAMGSTTNRVMTSDDLGVTWQARNFGQNWFPQKFADDGDGTLIALARDASQSGPSVANNPKLLISTNNGVAWLPVLNPLLGGDQNLLNDSDAGGAYTSCSVAYVPDPGAFVVVAGTSVYRSLDGVAWTRRTVSAFTDGDPFSSQPGAIPVAPCLFLAGVGPVVAAKVNWPVGVSPWPNRRPGVVYSFDLGDTWKLVDFGPIASNLRRATTIIEWNGRLVVGSPGAVYVSGLVANKPIVDFSADGP